jgi:signal transduction histidine kinase
MKSNCYEAFHDLIPQQKNSMMYRSDRNMEGTASSERLFQHIFESLTIGLMVLNKKGEIIAFNLAAERMTGMAFRLGHGRHFEVAFGAAYFSIPKLDFAYFSKIKEVTTIEIQLCGEDKAIKNIRITTLPLDSAIDNTIGWALMLQDITQLKKLEDDANRNGRLAAMGEMAVQIAHDIRNPLGSIELFASLLQRDLEGLEESQKLAEHISSGVKSINNIVANLLRFIKPDHRPDLKAIDLHQPIKDSLFFTEHLIGSRNSIELCTDFYPRQLFISGDAELLTQVSLNLILNAIQAMPAGGRLSVSTRMTYDEQGKQIAQMKIADTGCGISQANLSRIFDPFFTTRKNGTGLGLSIVHNITKAHGGHIDIASVESTGTTCSVTFPIQKPLMSDDASIYTSASGGEKTWR